MIEGAMWAMTVASLVGTVANIYKRRWCFAVWMVTNASWAIYDVYKTAYPQAALQGVYFGLAIFGLVAWKRKHGTPLFAESEEG